MGLLDALFRSSEILGIAEETLEFALESSEASHPNEYMGFLRGTEATQLGLDRDGLVITDILIVPGTEANSVSATVKTSSIPNDVKALGSVHSHPNGVIRPSQADLETFGRGSVHIIIGAPYRRSDWKAFDSQGRQTRLDVIDVALPDSEEFFDFTQADIDEELRG
ncbi:Mov34/MPN/PAD-1 family protein [Halobacteria archaeon AArc-curdl1]|uniref:Mov34/MPN/PAD-1 family protein n=1 Tax=Natronosalvus hydrolyticus TaxID=2979988 RepID=A0AAP3E557_9EURY|nr:Mov34/MPN/PAD-1 family protein [Halobacteria archaeon AArc-curdl1]